MSNIDKNLSNKRKKEEDSSDWLIYIFFLLFAVLIGLIIWLVYDKYYKENSTTYSRPINYEKYLGEKEENPEAKKVSALIRENRDNLKWINWVLDGKTKGKELTETEKENAREKLKGVNKKLIKTLQGWKISEIPPENLKEIYDQLYEEAKILLELRFDLSAYRKDEETKKQWEVQKKWDISEEEHDEIKKKLNSWIMRWYDKGIKEILPKKNLSILTEVIKPAVYNGKEVPREILTFPDERVVNSFKKKPWVYINTTIDLSKPLKNEFVGYNGFVEEKEAKNSSEGTLTMGLTTQLNGTTILPDEPSAPNQAQVFVHNCQKQAIRLKKELFFNRLGYNSWITKLGEENEKGELENGTSLDINFQQVVDTIAHELAHVLVNLTNFKYDGEEGGGHGALFYEVMEEVEKMMRASSEFVEFEKWWKENLPK